MRVAHKRNIQGVGPNDPRQRELKLTEMRRHIQVTGDISEEQVAILLWGANHCPVSNTLEGALPIETQLEIVK